MACATSRSRRAWWSHRAPWITTCRRSWPSSARAPAARPRPLHTASGSPNLGSPCAKDGRLCPCVARRRWPCLPQQQPEGAAMSANGKVVVNLATGLEDPERVTVAFLVAGAAAAAGKPVTMFLTKEAVRLALPGVAQGVACDGCPALPTLAAQYADAGGRMLVCPICFNARKLSQDELIDGSQLGGAPPLGQWIDTATNVFSS